MQTIAYICLYASDLPQSVKFYRDVLGLEEMNKRLEEKGVRLLDRSKETSYGTITNFCDPDGNKLEIIYQT